MPYQMTLLVTQPVYTGAYLVINSRVILLIIYTQYHYSVCMYVCLCVGTHTCKCVVRQEQVYAFMFPCKYLCIYVD